MNAHAPILNAVQEPEGEPSSVQRPGRREVLIGGALLATAALTFARMPRTPIMALPEGGIAAALPTSVGRWHEAHDASFVLPPSDEQAAAAIYEEQLTRAYDNGAGPTVMLLAAYDRSQSGLLQIHRPESCYPGSGFTLGPTIPLDVAFAPGIVADANFLTATRDDRIEQLLYWTRIGDAFPRDWHGQRRAIARQNLKGDVPDGVLVRMSVISADAEASQRLLVEFARALFAASPIGGKRLLAGPTNV